jgi:hypothetical protein
MWNVSSGATVGKPIRQLYLDGNTYQVKYGEPANYAPNDDRWNPSPQHPDERIAVTNHGQTLEWYNVVTQTVTRQWTLPFAVDLIGSGEGNPSNDGRFILLGENNPATRSYRMFMVDMDSQGGYAAYPNQRIGPAYDLAADGQMQPGWGVDWVSVSASGKYAVVMYSSNGIDKALRVFDINPNTLALTPHRMTASYPGMVGSPEQGFIYGLGHADLAIDPYGNNQDIIVGTENCGNVGKSVPGIPTVNGGRVGELVMVQLSNGQPTSLDDPTNEAGIAHVSTRNLDRPGWVYVSYYHGTQGQGGSRFRDEIVAVKMDGSGTAEQLADAHSDQTVSYYAYPMAVPSPDGKRVLFASNWAYDGNGNPTDYQDYVVDATSLTTPTTVQQGDSNPGAVEGRLAFSDARYQYFGLATDLGTLAGNYWAVFSTNGTTNWLYALVNTDGKQKDYKLGALPTGFHVYEVRPVSDAVQFSIDGTLRMTVPAKFPDGTALKMTLSTLDPSPQPPLQVDWVQVDL